jgi:hypothetical protein
MIIRGETKPVRLITVTKLNAQHPHVIVMNRLPAHRMQGLKRMRATMLSSPLMTCLTIWIEARS